MIHYTIYHFLLKTLLDQPLISAYICLLLLVIRISAKSYISGGCSDATNHCATSIVVSDWIWSQIWFWQKSVLLINLQKIYIASLNFLQMIWFIISISATIMLCLSSINEQKAVIRTFNYYFTTGWSNIKAAYSFICKKLHFSIHNQIP